MGVKVDRGEDDDGIQTVIPYFYGGDAHVVLIELWVTRPGPIADVTLKFKDMVTLDNSTARVSASLSRLPKDETPAERAVKRNVKGFEFAVALDEAAGLVRQGRYDEAKHALRQRASMAPSDVRVAAAFRQLVTNRRDARVGDALLLAKNRRVGYPP
jgi:soluble cytochrome b562